MKILLKILDKLMAAETAYAHCDIPCGIYDPHHAQMAAHTIVRMTDLINDLQLHDDNEAHEKEHHATFARHVAVKEQHAEIVKHEVRIIWGDYFKPEHAQKFPELHTLVWDIMKLASKAKQGVDRTVSEQLLEKVNRFAEIFWETKGVKTKKLKAPYPTGKEMVVPVLG